MDFTKAKNSYRENAIVQRDMAQKLVSYLIEKYGNVFDSVFEIGAGTGFLTGQITDKIKYKKLFLNDLTENFTGVKPDEYFRGDILKIKMPDSLDLVLSNAAIQWVFDYNTLFSKIHNSLKTGGIFCFSTFGKENFSQIKDITGIGLNYPDLADVLKKEGFSVQYFEEELKTLYFNDVKQLLGHIKSTGVKTENKFWTKGDFMNFQNAYLENHRGDLGFELTYHPVYYIVSAI